MLYEILKLTLIAVKIKIGIESIIKTKIIIIPKLFLVKFSFLSRLKYLWRTAFRIAYLINRQIGRIIGRAA